MQASKLSQFEHRILISALTLVHVTKVPSLKEVNFGKVKLWAVEHFWTDFDLTKRRDNKMDQIF